MMAMVHSTSAYQSSIPKFSIPRICWAVLAAYDVRASPPRLVERAVEPGAVLGLLMQLADAPQTEGLLIKHGGAGLQYSQRTQSALKLAKVGDMPSAFCKSSDVCELCDLCRGGCRAGSARAPSLPRQGRCEHTHHHRS